MERAQPTQSRVVEAREKRNIRRKGGGGGSDLFKDKRDRETPSTSK